MNLLSTESSSRQRVESRSSQQNDDQKLWLKNVSRGLGPLLSSCVVFIYLRARKRGFNHNPSGMALSHGGLGPVSRIMAENGEALLGPDPGAAQCHPHSRHRGMPKQTLPDRRERGGGRSTDNGVRKPTKDTQGFYLRTNASDRCTHQSASDILLLHCPAVWRGGKQIQKQRTVSVEWQQLTRREMFWRQTRLQMQC